MEEQVVKAAPEPKKNPHLLITMVGLYIAQNVPTFYAIAAAVIYPTIAAHFNAMQYYAILVLSNSVTSAILGPVAGKLGDLFGRKRIYLLAVAGFTIFFGLSCLSTSIFMFIGLQLIATGFRGFISSINSAIIGDLTTPEERPKYLGASSTISMIVQLLGPVVVGFMADTFNWRISLVALLPLSVLAFLILLRYLPGTEIDPARKPVVDFMGVIGLFAFLAPILLLLSAGGSVIPWNSPMVFVLLGVSVAGVAILAVVEPKHPAPIIALPLFKNSTFVRLFVMSLMTALAYATVMSYLPLYLQMVKGLSSTVTGTLTMPKAITSTIVAALLGPYLAKTRRYKSTLILCLSVALAGYVMMWLGFGPDTGTPYYMIATILTGVGATNLVVIVMSMVMSAIPREYMGAGVALTVFTASFAGALGSSICGMIVNSAWGKVVIPAELTAVLSPEHVAAMGQATILRNHELVSTIRATLPGDLTGLLDTTIASLKAAYSGALSNVFLLFVVATAIGIAIALTIKAAPAPAKKAQ